MLNKILSILVDTGIDLDEKTMIIIIVVVSIIAVSLIGALYYAQKKDKK